MERDIFRIFGYSSEERRVEGLRGIVDKKGKKGKKLKNWDNQNSIWQDRKRYN